MKKQICVLNIPRQGNFLGTCLKCCSFHFQAIPSKSTLISTVEPQLQNIDFTAKNNVGTQYIKTTTVLYCCNISSPSNWQLYHTHQLGLPFGTTCLYSTVCNLHYYFLMQWLRKKVKSDHLQISKAGISQCRLMKRGVKLFSKPK